MVLRANSDEARRERAEGVVRELFTSAGIGFEGHTVVYTATVGPPSPKVASKVDEESCIPSQHQFRSREIANGSCGAFLTSRQAAKRKALEGYRNVTWQAQSP